MNQAYSIGMACIVVFAIYFTRRNTPLQADRRVRILHGELSVDDPPRGRGEVIERYSTIMRKQIAGMQVGALVGLIWAILAGRWAPYSNLVGVVAGVWIGGQAGKLLGFCKPYGPRSFDAALYVPRSQLATRWLAPLLCTLPLIAVSFLTGRPGAVWTAVGGTGVVAVTSWGLQRLLPQMLQTSPGWSEHWDDDFRAEGVQQLLATQIAGPALIAGVVWARIAELTLARPPAATTGMWICLGVIVVLVLFGWLAPLGASNYRADD